MEDKKYVEFGDAEWIKESEYLKRRGIMIRLIIKCQGSNYDGTMDTWYETKIIEDKKLEECLAQKIGYAAVGSKRIVGQEIIQEQK
jgi:hypothetical protein